MDENLRNKLKNYESEVPDFIWEQVDKAVNGKRKNKPYLLYILSFVAIIFGLAGLLFQSYNTVAETSIEHGKSNVVHSEEINNKDQIDLPLIVMPEAESSTNKIKSTSLDWTTNSFLPSKLNITTKKDLPFRPVFTNPKEKKATKTEPKFSKNRVPNSPNLLIPAVASKQNKVHLLDPIKLASKNHKTLIFTNPIFDNITNKTFTFDENGNRVKQELYELLPVINSETKAVEKHPLDHIDNMTAVVYNSSDCPSWVREKLGLYLEVYGGPQYSIRNLTLKENQEDFTAYLNARNEMESSLISYSFGGRLLFLMPSGISIKAGFNYAQINEKYTYENPDYVTEVIVNDLETGLSDTSYHSGIFKEEIINRYKSIDIPVLIGYEKYFGRKISFNLNGGIYFNIMSEQRGKFLSPDQEMRWFSSSNNSNYRAFKDGIGLSLFASAGIMYHWVEGIDFFAEPHMRYYTGSLTLNDYPLDQKFLSLGLHCGLRYKF